jgi:dUTP pyrophosphatase
MSNSFLVKKVHPDAIIPQRGSSKASGLDLHALEDVIILPGETKLIRTGIAMSIPDGYEIQLRSRSGVSLKTPLRLANAVGTVDADYLGEIQLIAFNAAALQADEENINSGILKRGVSISIAKGDRIAQAVLCPVLLLNPVEVEEFPSDSERGSNGFGSTGV